MAGPTGLCWYEAVYICPDQPQRAPLDKAEAIFVPGKWEYVEFARGNFNVDSGKYQGDCKYLVDRGLVEAGYHATTEPWITNTWKDKLLYYYNWFNAQWQAWGLGYFCPEPFAEAGAGDIIFFGVYRKVGEDNKDLQYVSGHMGYISGPVTEDGNGGWKGQVFELSRIYEGPHEGRDWDTKGDNTVTWKGGEYEIKPMFVLRPKIKVVEYKCVDIELPHYAPPVRRLDPLVLDLDGNGIQTIGTSSGVHFDGDHNEFKELTGWTAPGEGLLMLDVNGNGRLDSGKELFGDFTILPNGVHAESGFQALAYYDANGDGKIDAQDPIWSHLRVWQYNDVLLASDSDFDGSDFMEALTSASDTGQRYFVAQSSSGCG